MFVIMGGSGHVGAATARALLGRGELVAIITHDASHADDLRADGAEVVEADVNDVVSLRRAFRRGRRALLLNPPADPSTDTDAVERQSVAHILKALDWSGLEKVVAVSTAGAQPGDRLGDLSVLWGFEQGLSQLSIPTAINRGAYYMSNWDTQFETVRQTGILKTMFPADLGIPMVASADLGAFAAQRLRSATDDVGIRYVEGPRRYCAADVATVLSQALRQPVDVAVTPRHQWREAFRALGFSESAANSYARMTAVSLDGGFDMPGDALRGSTTLDEHVRQRLARL